MAITWFEMAPRIGRWGIDFQDKAAAFVARRTEALSEIDQLVQSGVRDLEAGTVLSDDHVRYLFVLALMSDVLSSGGDFRINEGRHFLAWPDWNGPEGRDRAKTALTRFSSISRPGVIRQRTRAAFADGSDREALLATLQAGRIRLEPATSGNLHPGGESYGELFATAVRYWNMPITSREGRSRRFVATIESRTSAGPKVLGLIEIGDDAPINSSRDGFLALTAEAFVAWARSSRPDLSAIADRFARCRNLLGSVEGHSPEEPFHVVLKDEIRLVQLAAGITRLTVGWQRNKRVVYLLRLTRGERAIRNGALDPANRDVREGVRAWHDLVVPRIHQEVTICGALPPYSQFLAGKLVVALLGHPLIREAVSGPLGQITSSIFGPELATELPNGGLLLLTTKGLYPGYSRQYDRAVVPGRDGPVRLRRIGHTAGDTTTLTSDRTAHLARTVLDRDSSDRRVSSTFGTGGGKKMRQITAALAEVGLSTRLAYAGLERPIYALPLASNLPAAAWLLHEPAWIVPIGISSETYCETAFDLWRSRWLGREAFRDAHYEQRSVLNLLGGGPEP